MAAKPHCRRKCGSDTVLDRSGSGTGWRVEMQDGAAAPEEAADLFPEVRDRLIGDPSDSREIASKVVVGTFSRPEAEAPSFSIKS